MNSANTSFSGLHSLATQDRQKKHSAAGGLLVIIATFFFNIYLVVADKGTADGSQYLLGSAILWVAIVPTLVQLSSPARRTPVFPLICIIFFIYYGYPIFSTKDFFLSVGALRPEALTAGLEAALIGIVCLVGGFYAARIDRVPMLHARVDFNFLEAEGRVSLVGALVTVVHLFTAFFAVILPGQLFRATEMIGLISLMSIFSTWLRGQAKPIYKVLFLVCMGLWCLKDLGTGSIANVIVDLILLVFVYIRTVGKIPFLSLFVMGVLLIPFLQTKYAFRDETWQEGVTMGPIDRGTHFIGMTVDRVSSGEVTRESATKNAESRFNHLSTIAYVTEVTPQMIPYSYGESYLGIFWTLIPRLLYPDKPTKTLGNDFGHQYGLLGNDDTTTSYNFEQLTESYVNFGTMGVVFFHLLSGALYRAFTVMFDRDDSGEGAKIIFAVFGIGMLNIESDFSLVFGSMPYLAFLLLAYMRFIAQGTGGKKGQNRAGPALATAR